MNEMTFEQKMARLEEIVAKLEKGDAQLSDSLQLFEEGTRLVSACRGELDIEGIKKISQNLRENGLIDDKTVLCVNHFSHNATDVLYKKREVYEKDGYVMSYDGLEIEF